MSFKRHFEVRRDTAKVEKIKEVKGLDCLVPCGDTTETNDNGLVSWALLLIMSGLIRLL